MKDYTKNSLAFGYDKVDGLEIGEAKILIRQYEIQNKRGIDRVISVKGEILAVSTVDSDQLIVFRKKGDTKVSILYANGAEGCFKDWIFMSDENYTNGEKLERHLTDDFTVTEDFITFIKQMAKEDNFAPIFEIVRRG